MAVTHDLARERRANFASCIAAAPRRGLALSFVLALLIAISCLFSWANIDLFIFSKSYPGTHFGEGRLALALGLAALAAAAAAFAVARLVYTLPLLGATALGVVGWKYHDVADATSSRHGFHVATVSVGGGLRVALIAAALLLGASLLAVLDHINQAAQRRDVPASEEASR